MKLKLISRQILIVAALALEIAPRIGTLLIETSPTELLVERGQEVSTIVLASFCFDFSSLNDLVNMLNLPSFPFKRWYELIIETCRLPDIFQLLQNTNFAFKDNCVTLQHFLSVHKLATNKALAEYVITDPDLCACLNLFDKSRTIQGAPPIVHIFQSLSTLAMHKLLWNKLGSIEQVSQMHDLNWFHALKTVKGFDIIEMARVFRNTMDPLMLRFMMACQPVRIIKAVDMLLKDRNDRENRNVICLIILIAVKRTAADNFSTLGKVNMVEKQIASVISAEWQWLLEIRKGIIEDGAERVVDSLVSLYRRNGIDYEMTALFMYLLNYISKGSWENRLLQFLRDVPSNTISPHLFGYTGYRFSEEFWNKLKDEGLLIKLPLAVISRNYLPLDEKIKKFTRHRLTSTIKNIWSADEAIILFLHNIQQYGSLPVAGRLVSAQKMLSGQMTHHLDEFIMDQCRRVILKDSGVSGRLVSADVSSVILASMPYFLQSKQRINENGKLGPMKIEKKHLEKHIINIGLRYQRFSENELIYLLVADQ